jgi:hypothetical protein
MFLATMATCHALACIVDGCAERSSRLVILYGQRQAAPSWRGRPALAQEVTGSAKQNLAVGTPPLILNRSCYEDADSLRLAPEDTVLHAAMLTARPARYLIPDPPLRQRLTGAKLSLNISKATRMSLMAGRVC